MLVVSRPSEIPPRSGSAPYIANFVFRGMRGRWRERFTAICDDCMASDVVCAHFPELPLRCLLHGHNPSEHAFQSGFFYSNPTNRMWLLLTGRLGTDPKLHFEGLAPPGAVIEDQNRLALERGVGLSDLGVEPGNDAASYSTTVLLAWREDMYRAMAGHVRRAGDTLAALWRIAAGVASVDAGGGSGSCAATRSSSSVGSKRARPVESSSPGINSSSGGGCARRASLAKRLAAHDDAGGELPVSLSREVEGDLDADGACAAPTSSGYHYSSVGAAATSQSRASPATGVTGSPLDRTSLTAETARRILLVFADLARWRPDGLLGRSASTSGASMSPIVRRASAAPTAAASASAAAASSGTTLSTEGASDSKADLPFPSEAACRHPSACAPRIVAFTGKGQWKALFEPPLKTCEHGLQPAGVRPPGWPLPPSTAVFVLSSSSGRAAMTDEERRGPYKELAGLVKGMPWLSSEQLAALAAAVPGWITSSESASSSSSSSSLSSSSISSARASSEGRGPSNSSAGGDSSGGSSGST